MSKVIKISKDWELGEILAQIAKSEDNAISLEVASDSTFLKNKKENLY